MSDMSRRIKTAVLSALFVLLCVLDVTSTEYALGRGNVVSGDVYEVNELSVYLHSRGFGPWSIYLVQVYAAAIVLIPFLYAGFCWKPGYSVAECGMPWYMRAFVPVFGKGRTLGSRFSGAVVLYALFTMPAVVFWKFQAVAFNYMNGSLVRIGYFPDNGVTCSCSPVGCTDCAWDAFLYGYYVFLESGKYPFLHAVLSFVSVASGIVYVVMHFRKCDDML